MIILHLPSWFPHPEKPLDGNFILRQIGTVADQSTSIVLHHVDIDFRQEAAQQIREGLIFWPIFTQPGTSQVQMVRAYDYEVEKIIKKYGKPDLIHLHVALPLGPLAVYLSLRYRIPLVLSEHWSGYQPQNRVQFTWRQRRFLQIIYQRAAHLTTVSHDLHQAIVKTVRSARKLPYTQISNVVNTRIFHPNLPETEPEENPKRILHISTLDDRAKNILGILRMVKALSMRRQDFVLDIIHDLRNEAVENYVREEHLEAYVHLLGQKSEAEVAEAIQACDFMLQFSNYENQPCVLLEAFCCGKPVIATTVGGIPDIANPTNARLVAPGDEAMLLEEADYLLDHASEYDAARISQEATERYAPEVIGRQFMELYQSIKR